MRSSWFLLVVLLSACGGKRTATGSSSPTNIDEFFNLFPTIKLPHTLSDNDLLKIKNDSAIAYDVFTSFVSDTLFSKTFGEGVKPKIYADGKVSVKKGETYVFIKTSSGNKKIAFVLAFDKQKQYKAALPLIVSDTDPATTQSSTMDARYTISINSQRKKPNGDLGYKKAAYVFNNIGVFTLILTESNDDLASTGEVINPLDTLPRRNRLAGDYIVDKRNFISIRDGRNPNQLRFFIHFEKAKGTCKGELRADAIIERPNVAVYRESGDPCVLEFNFTNSSVSIKELEGCGNYRDIKCFFEGSYPRKKEKPKSTRAK